MVTVMPAISNRMGKSNPKLSCSSATVLFIFFLGVVVMLVILIVCKNIEILVLDHSEN